MSKKRKSNTSSSATNDDGDIVPTTNFDWGSIFPASRIKSQLQNEDENLGRLPKKTLHLISNCSALLLRQIVQKSLAKKKDNDNQQPAIILSAQDLLRGVQASEALSFLEESVQEATQQDDGKLAPVKRKRSTASNRIDPSKSSTSMRENAPNTKSAKKPKISGNRGVEEALEVVSEKQTSTVTAKLPDKIVVDEEDYD